MCVEEYMGGGRRLPELFDVLVSTPAAFEITKGRHTPTCRSPLGWESFRLMVFDEVHLMLKDHPYRKLSYGICKLDVEKECLESLV